MATRKRAEEVCEPMSEGDTNHTSVENVKQKCYSENEIDCLPIFANMNTTLNSAKIKEALGVPEDVGYLSYSPQVAQEFAGDT